MLNVVVYAKSGPLRQALTGLIGEFAEVTPAADFVPAPKPGPTCSPVVVAPVSDCPPETCGMLAGQGWHVVLLRPCSTQGRARAVHGERGDRVCSHDGAIGRASGCGQLSGRCRTLTVNTSSVASRKPTYPQQVRAYRASLAGTRLQGQLAIQRVPRRPAEEGKERVCRRIP